MNANDYINAWDKRVGKQTAHIDLTEEKKEQINNTYRTALKLCGKQGGGYYGKKLIDFGCGGGYLARMIWDKVAAYIGMDISKRSIDSCMANISGSNCRFQLIAPYKLPDIKELEADILVSISVIQHFPDQDYLDYFLDWLNKTGVKILLLQIRYNKDNIFQSKIYHTTHEINLACWTNADYLKSKLANYKLIKKTQEEINEYNYIRFDLK